MNGDLSMDCPKHGRTKYLMLNHEGDPPGEKKPVCTKCLADAMVLPIRRSSAAIVA